MQSARFQNKAKHLNEICGKEGMLVNITKNFQYKKRQGFPVSYIHPWTFLIVFTKHTDHMQLDTISFCFGKCLIQLKLTFIM